MRLLRSTLLWGSLGSLLIAAPSAQASGISVARFGGEQGHPTTTNATALYYNPAGIGMSEGFHGFVDFTLAWRKASYDHRIQPNQPGSFGDDGSIPGANDGRADLFNIIASPMLGLTGKFGDFAVGAAFYTPFGGQSKWGKNDAFENHPNTAGAYDGQQRFYNISGQLRSSFLTGGLAYHLRDAGLSFGLTGNLILSQTKTIRAKGLSGSNALSGEGRAILETSGTDFSMGVGIMAEPIPKELWLGASYQSRPNFTGMKPQSGTQETFLGQKEAPVNADFYTDLPDVFRIGASFRPDPRTELRLSGDYQRWSVLEDQRVVNTDLGDGGKSECDYEARDPANPSQQSLGSCLLAQKRDWKDTFGVRAGFSRWVSKRTELFTGMGYSSNAIADEWLEPALMDFNGVSFSAGTRVELVDDIHVAISYTQIIYEPRDTQGKSRHDEGRGPPPAGGGPPTPNSIENGPDSSGTYKQMIGVFNLNADFKF